MALGTDHVIASEVGNFIPEIWSDEIVASYKANLVARNLIRILNHKGKKGDTIRIPTPTRASASSKAAETQVTLIQHGTDTGITATIDKHYEYSRLIEDFADVQALESLRRFYVDDAGYAIAKQVDTDVIVEGLLGLTAGYTASTNVIESTAVLPTVYEGDGTTWDETASTDLTDAGIRTVMQVLDDQNVPFANRYLLVPPIVKKDLLGIARFTETQFVGEVAGGNTIRNGLIGNVYNMPVFVSTQMPIVDDSTGNATERLSLMFQQDAAVLVEQMGMRVQKQYKQEYLADLMTADTIYGTEQLRATSVAPIVTPNS